MAAPSIPNLNAFKASRGQARGRGLSSLGGPLGRTRDLAQVSNDKIIQQTDQDASVSRMSAVDLGYLKDPFAKYFMTAPAQKRYPIINRGTYVRTCSIDTLVDAFLASPSVNKKQIISLGAGTDTRFFRLGQKQKSSPIDFLYHELDFPENTQAKIAIIKRTPALKSCFQEPIIFGSPTIGADVDNMTRDVSLRSPSYNIHPIDLRTLAAEAPLQALSLDGIDTSRSTLILSECCLVYLTPDMADRAAQYFTKHLFPSTTSIGLIIYEPIQPQDAFGKTMVSNLAARGIVLQTLRKYSDLDAQAARMKAYGLVESHGADVGTLWTDGVDDDEKGRVAGLEMLDELEEWDLLAAHYCVIWGWREDKSLLEGRSGVFDQWRRVLRSK